MRLHGVGRTAVTETGWPNSTWFPTWGGGISALAVKVVVTAEYALLSRSLSEPYTDDLDTLVPGTDGKVERKRDTLLSVPVGTGFPGYVVTLVFILLADPPLVRDSRVWEFSLALVGCSCREVS